MHLEQSKAKNIAFFFSKGECERKRVLFLAIEQERERIRHFKERTNALGHSEVNVELGHEVTSSHSTYEDQIRLSMIGQC